MNEISLVVGPNVTLLVLSPQRITWQKYQYDADINLNVKYTFSREDSHLLYILCFLDYVSIQVNDLERD